MPGTVPDRFCDLIMKGGITSGVVYPLAICELSKAFRFRSIGGTSVGAIAAAAAAAAEYGRGKPGAGFELLAGLPQFLGEPVNSAKDTRLFSLFQPQQSTRPVFRTLTAALGGGRWAWLRVLAAAFRNFPLAFLSGLAVAAIPFSTLDTDGTAWQQIVIVALTLLLAAVACLVFTGAAFVLRLRRGLADNYFGLCTGMAGSGAFPAMALTPWLHEYLNTLAGLDPGGRPLTFGDLWGKSDSQSEPRICLEVVTTCLTMGRPFHLPFRDDEEAHESKQFYFRPDEFSDLFPTPVVDWMVKHSRDRDVPDRQKGFYALPDPQNLPVVVAARMSLSFPLLLSAVPLYAVDLSRKDEADRVKEVCWFSDGGIGSNFPIQLFDAPVPRWPTFAIDLGEKHPDFDAGVFMPKTNGEAILPDWSRFGQTPGFLGPMFGFAFATLDTMMNWSHETQARLPGYRDRIAVIRLNPLDGGLNLNMDAGQIKRLSEYGRQAGVEFVRRFTETSPDVQLDWHNHRWVRLRSFLGCAEALLKQLERTCEFAEEHHESFEDLITGCDGIPKHAYRWRNELQQHLASQTLQALRDLSLDTDGESLVPCSPKPRPELRPRPRI